MLSNLPLLFKKAVAALWRCLFLTSLSLLFIQPASALGPAFVCDGTPYTTINSASILQSVDNATLTTTNIGSVSPTDGLNAIGYNILDNYIYGLDSSSTEVIRLSADASWESLGEPTGVGNASGIDWSDDVRTHSGTMDSSGNLYLHSVSYVYIVSIGSLPSAGTLTYDRIARSGTATVVADLAFNPLNSRLYGVSGSKLIEIDSSGVGSVVATTGSTLQTSGGAWSNATGILYFYANSRGQLYSVDMNQSTPVVAWVGSVSKNGTFDATACTPPSLDKVMVTEVPASGEPLTFNFTLTNPLPTPLAVSFSDDLPSGFTFVAGSLSTTSPGGGTVTTFNDDTLAISNITIPSGISPSNTVSFTAQVMAETLTGVDLPNQATLIFGVNTLYSDNPETEAVGDGTTVTVHSNDMGDAPDSYGESKHTLNTTDYYLGATPPDSELQSQNTANGGTDGTGDNEIGVADEDGVTVPLLTRTLTVDIAVDVNQVDANTGYLQAWIDWNADGDFTDTGEQVVTDLQSATAGSSTLIIPVAVPETAVVTDTFARFRWSPNSGIDSTSVTAGGEVEDYLVTVDYAQDWGDAPTDLSLVDGDMGDSYGDASHVYDETVYLGSSIDVDAASQNSSSLSDGDDTNGVDDEDGVAFDLLGGAASLRVDSTNTYTVTASVNGFLNAWIDWNQDGDWDDADEQIATNEPLSAGSNTLSVAVSAEAPQGVTYTRFRFTTASVAIPSPLGLLDDGEVEDHTVHLLNPPAINICDTVVTNGGMEGGPFPGTYVITPETSIPGWATIPVDKNTGTFANRNKIEVWASGFGGVPAFEGNHFVELNANYAGMLYQDVALVPGSSYNWKLAHRGRAATDVMNIMMGTPGAEVLQTTVSTGRSAWVQYSGTYVVPAGEFITRFGFQAATGAGTGNFLDAVSIPGGCDFGDAPDSYGTLFTSNGAYHISNASLQIGTVPGDPESTGKPSVGADGDDIDTTADEDAIGSFKDISIYSKTYSIDIKMTNNTGSIANLAAWIDFDQNGTFDADEYAKGVVQSGVNGGTTNLTWPLTAPDITAGDTYLRLRTSTESISSFEATGQKKDGEVEDYAITIHETGIEGRVFEDANANGIYDSGELGIGGTVIVLFDSNSGECLSQETNGAGEYLFAGMASGSYEVYQAHGETAPTPQNCGVASISNPPGYSSTSADALTVIVTSLLVSDQNFGELKSIVFSPDNQGAIPAGTAVYYKHTFQSEADGSVNFSTSGTLNITDGWLTTVFNDANCDGNLDAAEAATPVNGIDIAILSGGTICLVNKVFAPSNAIAQEQFGAVVTATMTFAGGALAPEMLSVLDMTTSMESTSSALTLVKTVENITQGTPETSTANEALPGDTLKYRISYANNGIGSITDLVVNDDTPFFTSYVTNSESCDNTPSTLSCTIVVNGTAVQWTITGQLLGGSNGQVSYEVIVDN